MEWQALEREDKIRYRDIPKIDGKIAIEIKVMQTGTQYTFIHDEGSWKTDAADLTVTRWRARETRSQNYWSWVADKLLELDAIPEGLF